VTASPIWTVLWELHRLGAAATALTLAAFALMSLGVAWLDRAGRPDRAFRILRVAVSAVASVTASAGLALFALGSRGFEPLHLLYGIAVLVVLPAAANFSAEAPPRQRTVIMAVAAAIALLLVWRLYATG